MKLSDRRLARRFNITVPLYIRVWKSQAPEQKVESVNISEHGVYFVTDTILVEGAMVQIRLEMPKEITDQPTDEWRCTGKVVRIYGPTSPGGLVGVSVRFDYYEVARTTSPSPVLALSEDN